jgi:hypothetical protein
MVGKLALMVAQSQNDPDSENWLGRGDKRPVNRDEVRLVIVDTSILCGSDDPSALLEKWLGTA